MREFERLKTHQTKYINLKGVRHTNIPTKHFRVNPILKICMINHYKYIVRVQLRLVKVTLYVIYLSLFQNLFFMIGLCLNNK